MTNETKWGKALTGPEMKALGLPDDTPVSYRDRNHLPGETASYWDFEGDDPYFLPENHPAYTVHETNKRTGSRFKFHAGGSKPDGEIVRVLYRSGVVGNERSWWDWRDSQADIIGYELAVDVSETPVDDHQSDLSLADDTQADTVTIKRMTEAERTRLYPHPDLNTLKDLRLIREETREERFWAAHREAKPNREARRWVAAALNWGR